MRGRGGDGREGKSTHVSLCGFLVDLPRFFTPSSTAATAGWELFLRDCAGLLFVCLKAEG
jgi:hypothetical protein